MLFHDQLIGVIDTKSDYKIIRSYVSLPNKDRIFHTQFIPSNINAYLLMIHGYGDS